MDYFQVDSQYLHHCSYTPHQPLRKHCKKDSDSQGLSAISIIKPAGRQNWDVMVSSKNPSSSLDDRDIIIAQAAAMGLQLSDDGQNWIPLEKESVTKMSSKDLAKSEIISDEKNVPIVKIPAKISTANSIIIAVFSVGGVTLFFLLIIGLILSYILFILLQIDSMFGSW